MLRPVVGLCKTVVQKLHRRYTTLMLSNNGAVRTYFAKLGFEPEVADIYLALHSNGPQTISELSRNSKVERTRIYRLIDTLLSSSLIEVESHYKRGVIKAAPIANLNILITQREQELKSLQDELELVQRVLASNSLSSPAARVQFYHGIEGVRQMQWNQVKSKTDSLSICHEPLNDALGKAFILRWAEAMNQNGVHIRVIKSQHFHSTNKKWYEKHKIPEILPSHESRLVSTDFPVHSNMDIWEDAVAYYNWKDGDIFGIEIYNKEIADVQRQFFEMLWAKSTPETRF